MALYTLTITHHPNTVLAGCVGSEVNVELSIGLPGSPHRRNWGLRRSSKLRIATFSTSYSKHGKLGSGHIFSSFGMFWEWSSLIHPNLFESHVEGITNRWVMVAEFFCVYSWGNDPI